nr:hypothetical protein [Roseateles sp. XES5]
MAYRTARQSMSGDKEVFSWTLQIALEWAADKRDRTNDEGNRLHP